MFKQLNLIDHHIYRGGILPALKAAAGYQYLLAGNGVFIQAQNRHWQAVIPAIPGTIRGLPELETQVVARRGQLPGVLLASALTDAKRSCDANGRTIETLYYLNSTANGRAWQLHRPSQTGQECLVETNEPPGTETAVQLHTHGSYAAYFSNIDNADEQGLCVYGVLGRVTTPRPQICLRIGVYGYFHPLRLSDVFSPVGIPENLEEIPAGKGRD